MNEYNVWELFSLRNRVALVTGGASGLGYDMALALAEAGADIAITSRHLAKAQRSAEEIASENALFQVRPLKEWKYTVDVNVTGSFLFAKYVVAKCMIPSKRGVIINVGSTAGMIGKDRRVHRGTDAMVEYSFRR